MSCKEAQRLFIPFLDDTVNGKELDAFLRHLENCQECREEYEIYYTMIMGMRYLESDAAKGAEWVNPWEKLRNSREYLFKCRILHWEKIAILVILCIGGVLLL